MSRKSTIEPRWLVSMLKAWVKNRMRSWSGGLGYPSKVPFILPRVDGGKRSSDDYDLWGVYTADDYKEVDKAMHELEIQRHELYAAVTMYYKPWTVESLKLKGYPFSPSKTYYRRLHDAHCWLVPLLEHVERKYQEEDVDVCL